ncbi:uncharacterized protein LOC144551861 [Carex rostrata]
MKVAQLRQHDSGLWDAERLTKLFGYETTMQILSSIQPPDPLSGTGTLIFTPAASGRFSVKLVYKELHNRRNRFSAAGVSQSVNNADNLWFHIWKKGKVVPRVRVFMWKLMHNGLPWGKVMADRLGCSDQNCQTCDSEPEDAMHWMVRCQFSRMCWFASDLGIRTEGVTLSVQEFLLWMAKQTSDEQWTTFANCLWALWRCRNGLAYQGIRPSHATFQSYLNSIQGESMLFASAIGGRGLADPDTVPRPDMASLNCFSDGSWKEGRFGGIGFVFTQNGVLKGYVSAGLVSCSAFQAEAAALLQAIRFTISNSWDECNFCSDSSTLVSLCTGLQPPLEAD